MILHNRLCVVCRDHDSSQCALLTSLTFGNSQFLRTHGLQLTSVHTARVSGLDAPDFHMCGYLHQLHQTPQPLGISLTHPIRTRCRLKKPGIRPNPHMCG